MIVFDLKCQSGGHVFEAWFGSSADYESQRDRGLVQCPICGSEEVEKAVMAPMVGAKGNQARTSDMHAMVSSSPEQAKAMLAALAAMQTKLLEKSDYVGERFAEEARSMHLGESAARSIHGKATRAEAESLVEDGVPVAPLPFPVVAPGEEN